MDKANEISPKTVVFPRTKLSSKKVFSNPWSFNRGRIEQIVKTTLANAIMDLIVHQVHRIELKRESIRKKKVKMNQ